MDYTHTITTTGIHICVKYDTNNQTKAIIQKKESYGMVPIIEHSFITNNKCIKISFQLDGPEGHIDIFNPIKPNIELISTEEVKKLTRFKSIFFKKDSSIYVQGNALGIIIERTTDTKQESELFALTSEIYIDRENSSIIFESQNEVSL